MGNYEKEKFLISKNVPSLLQDVPFHSKNEAIERSAPEGFPLHIAVHNILEDSSKGNYVSPHKHEVPEINVLIGSDGSGLEYEIQIGDELHKVESPASIYIPAGVIHAANHVRGKGSLVCIILASPETAFGPEK